MEDRFHLRLTGIGDWLLWWLYYLLDVYERESVIRSRRSNAGNQILKMGTRKVPICAIWRRERIVNSPPNTLFISLVNLYFTVSVTLLSPKVFFETYN